MFHQASFTMADLSRKRGADAQACDARPLKQQHTLRATAAVFIPGRIAHLQQPEVPQPEIPQPEMLQPALEPELPPCQHETEQDRWLADIATTGATPDEEEQV